jgi:hypothetical protein
MHILRAAHNALLRLKACHISCYARSALCARFAQVGGDLVGNLRPQKRLWQSKKVTFSAARTVLFKSV